MFPRTPNGLAGAVVLAIATAAVSAAGIPTGTQRVGSGFNRPIFATSPVGDFDRLFVAEQHTGRIRILDPDTGTINATPFLDINSLATGNEQGLLGMAFDPDYATNGFFYVNVTVSGGTTHIRRYQISANPDIANAASAQTVMTYSQPFSNHNGGWLGFGPNDGLLYISSGDGGAGNDPGGRGQDITNNLLGKMLRIDPSGDDFPADAGRNYANPASNPFVGVTGDDEIWAYGLRNPWRSSFDRVTGDLYIADVGQNAREEVDFQPVASSGGENYGWRLREGTIATPTGGVGGNAPPGAVDPIYEYTHGGGAAQGFSITGGYVYRGPVADIQGHYFFADYVTDRIWSFRYDGVSLTEFTDRTAQFA
nr:PQQ-dependent sugar dehydrogenase [Phycisphaerae bacterium]